VGGAALAAAVVGACSLIVDTNANQCAVLSDCDQFPGFRACTMGVCEASLTEPPCKANADCSTYAQATCDTASGFCTRPCMATSDCGLEGLTCGSNGTCTGTPTTDGGAPCTLNADCSNLGTTYVCRNARCADLLSPQCPTVHATTANAAMAYALDDAIIFGSIMPTGSTSGDAPFGQVLEDSINLALDDFGKVNGIPGLTGGSASRPLVVVHCNDGPNEDASLTDVAAKHLINDLGVPAIIGYAFSGNTLSVAGDVTIPDKTLLFSSSATSAQLTTLEATDSDLFWRTCPSDNVQAQALALHYTDVEAAALAKYPMIDSSNIKVAIVNHSDLYGSGLGDTLQMNLTFNGMPATAQTGTNYLRVNYGPSTSPDLTKIPVITAFAPDIIFLFGFNEGPDVIFKDVEMQWTLPADGHRPFWIFSDGGEDSSLWASSTNPTTPADITTEDQRERVSGSVPGTTATAWPPYGTFLTEFGSSPYSGDTSPDQLGPAGAYDILYLLAYSTVMVGKNPLTGPNLVKLGLQKMQKTAGIPMAQISPDNILSTFQLLSSDAPINISGVSGPLPFTGKGDITTADIQIWCVPPATPPDTDVGGAAINSGYYFDSTTQKMAGCLSTTCALPMNPQSCP
jgi:hypothetical protein